MNSYTPNFSIKDNKKVPIVSNRDVYLDVEFAMKANDSSEETKVEIMIDLLIPMDHPYCTSVNDLPEENKNDLVEQISKYIDYLHYQYPNYQVVDILYEVHDIDPANVLGRTNIIIEGC